MWANVRRGEKLYISPFKEQADPDAGHGAGIRAAGDEPPGDGALLRHPGGIERYAELKQVLPAIQLFGEIDEALVAPDSLVREFIGGGIYDQ